MTIKDAANIMKNLFIELTIENDVLTDEEKDAFVFVANILVEQDKKLYEDAISRAEAIRIASGYCHYTNIPDELAKLPSVNPKPCEDAISRQAVLDGLARIAKAKARSDAQKSLMGRTMFFVERLPPVTPAPKNGKWIVKEKVRKEPKYEYETYGVCDQCGMKNYAGIINYCPNCGCRMMVEPRESEE